MASGWFGRRSLAYLAGLSLLVLSVAPEAVIWCAEMFDVFVMAVIAGMTSVGLLVLFFTRQPRDQLRPVIVASMWTIASILPVAPFFPVGADLQDARYLYLPAVGWSMLVAGLVGDRSTSRPAAALAMAIPVLTIGLDAGVLRIQIRPWLQAAAVRSQVEAARPSAGELVGCRSIAYADLPDSFEGACILPNGAVEAMASFDESTRSSEGVRCTSRWNAPAHMFVNELRN